MPFLLKVLITALVVAGVSDLGKRFTAAAAVLASLPLTSILAMLWLYRDTGDARKIIDLSRGIFWAVLPSLLFFVVLPALLRAGVKFGLAMMVACLTMAAGYALYAAFLSRFGIRI